MRVSLEKYRLPRALQGLEMGFRSHPSGGEWGPWPAGVQGRDEGLSREAREKKPPALRTYQLRGASEAPRGASGEFAWGPR